MIGKSGEISRRLGIFFPDWSYIPTRDARGLFTGGKQAKLRELQAELPGAAGGTQRKKINFIIPGPEKPFIFGKLWFILS